MSGVRPKRKATANKSYNDTLEEITEDDKLLISTATSSVSLAKKKNSKKNDNGDSKIIIPYNYQLKPANEDYFSNRLDLTDAYLDLSSQTLHCPNHLSWESRKSMRYDEKLKDGFYLTKGDYIYMISEPPGEPYYLGRIIGFTSKKISKNDESSLKDPIVDANDYMFQIQWFYRPRDISKSTNDSRLLFASMHTDTCPFVSYRGLITVRHKQDIENEFNSTHDESTIKRLKKSYNPVNSSTSLEIYSLKPNCFYFDKLFDRYMIKFYEILLTDDLLQYGESESSKSKSFLTALNKRFEFIFVESIRTKGLISSFSSSSRNCQKCDLWCDSPQDTINCVVCHKFYHMYCLDPPLLKKPSRGFSWACAVCTKEQELVYQRKRIVMLSHDNKSSNEGEITTDLSAISSPIKEDDSAETSLSNSPLGGVDDDPQYLPTYEIMANEFLEADSDLTLEERRLKEEWPMRYLGQHARLEDGVDLKDRNPYPRASTRLGAKHQATNIPEFNGHPIVYYDSDKLSLKKKSGATPKKKKPKSSEEIAIKLEVPSEFAELSIKDYPEWLQPRPKGYIERGLDEGETTSTLLWKSSESDKQSGFSNLDLYIESCNPIAEKLGISPNSPNFVDYILLQYMNLKQDSEEALKIVSKVTKKVLKEPTFNREEIKRFENGVKKYGSELHPVQKLVKSQNHAMVVRFYYLWKKSKNGKLIWGNFEGRRHKKLQNVVKDEAKIETPSIVPAIDILADPEDDSSYEDEKIIKHKSKFICKHCDTRRSYKWFRITGHDANSKEKLENGEVTPNIFALCFRCAKLWRRYAVEWESPEEVEKKTTKVTGWKKKVEYELLKDTETILAEAESTGAIISYEVGYDDLPALEEAEVESKPEVVKKPARKPKKEVADISPQPKVEVVKKPKSEPKPPRVKPVKVKENIKFKVEKPKPPPKKGRPRAVKMTEKAKEEQVSEEVKIEDKQDEKNEDIPKEAKKPALKKKPKEPVTKKVKLEENGTVNEPAQKKQRKQPTLESLIDQLKNLSYINNLHLEYKITKANDTKEAAVLQASSKSCSVCIQDSNPLDMFICSHCGVNVHHTCGGISIPEKMPRPVTEWLCEVCVNNMKQLHSRKYSCDLCYSKPSIIHTENSIIAKHNYLKPVYETGKWCHILCAAFSSYLVGFRSYANNIPKKLTKDDLHTKKIDLINKTIAVESVSKVHINNFRLKCGICHKHGGSLVKCEESDIMIHVSCAQDDENYKVGFKFDESDEVKNIRFNGKTGALKPAIGYHQLKTIIHPLGELGQRVNLKEGVKPFIQMYLEDLAKNNVVKFNGPYLRSLEWLQSVNKNDDIEEKIVVDSICNRCKTKSSPIWWDDINEEGKEICQRCFHFQDEGDSKESSPTEGFIDVLNRPLNGELYGIIDENDRVRIEHIIDMPAEKADVVMKEDEGVHEENALKSSVDSEVQVVNTEPNSIGYSNGVSHVIPPIVEPRSKISLGDILS